VDPPALQAPIDEDVQSDFREYSWTFTCDLPVQVRNHILWEIVGFDATFHRTSIAFIPTCLRSKGPSPRDRGTAAPRRAPSPGCARPGRGFPGCTRRAGAGRAQAAARMAA